MEVIRNHIASFWGLKQSTVVGLMDPRHVLVKLASAEDLAIVWTRESHQMEGALFCLFIWSKNFQFGKKSPIAHV